MLPGSFIFSPMNRNVWGRKCQSNCWRNTQTIRKRCFLRNSLPLMQMAVLKIRGVSGSFYKNVVLKNLRTKMRKIRPKPGLQHVYLLHDNAPAHKSSTAAKILKYEKVHILSHPPYSPDLTLCNFPIFEIEENNTYLVGDICPEVLWGLQFTSFLWVYPKMSMKSVWKIGFKDWNDVFWIKRNISKVTKNNYQLPILVILKIKYRSIPLKPALGGVYSLANYRVAYEDIQSNRVYDFRDFVCSLFPKAILFDLFFFLNILLISRRKRVICKSLRTPSYMRLYWMCYNGLLIWNSSIHTNLK